VLAAYFLQNLHLVGHQLFSVYHSVGHQPDVNFIQLAASRMQISFSQPPAGCKLHPANGHAIQNTQIYQ
jgi:hypothetical protein